MKDPAAYVTELEKASEALLAAVHKMRDYQPRIWESLVREDWNELRRVLDAKK